jgi:ornithine carbamoyltransferase
LKDLSTAELVALIRAASSHKTAIKANTQSDTFRNGLQGQTVGLVFSKRSTRTRISTEGAVTALGGHAMFLGKDDIQLGVNETLKDTSIVMSSMMASIVARVNKHADVAGLAEHSSVPVVNAMCDLYHPLQGLADYLTMFEVLGRNTGSGLGLEGTKICWIGDATNGMFYK